MAVLRPPFFFENYFIDKLTKTGIIAIVDGDTTDGRLYTVSAFRRLPQ